MFLEALVLGSLVGWLRGGSLKNIVNQPLFFLPLAIVAFLLQSILSFDFSRAGYLTPYIFHLHLFSYLLLFLFIYYNRKSPGMLIMGVGILLNFLVIAANGGTMPVSSVGLRPELKEILLQGEALHALTTAESKLLFLADVIPLYFPAGSKMSVGDIFLSAGLFYFLQQGMMRGFCRHHTDSDYSD